MDAPVTMPHYLVEIAIPSPDGTIKIKVDQCDPIDLDKILAVLEQVGAIAGARRLSLPAPTMTTRVTNPALEQLRAAIPGMKPSNGQE